MALELVSPTDQIRSDRFAHSAATTARTPLLINSKLFLPVNTAAANELNEFVWTSELKGATCAGSEAWTVGAKVYWDNTNSRFTVTATSNTLCGYATQPKAAADTTTPRFLFNTFAA